MANVVLRLGNVYGPRQNPHGEAGVVAIFSGLLLDGERPALRGEGKPTRDYVYVTDVANAFVAAADGARAGTYNVGTGARPRPRACSRSCQTRPERRSNRCRWSSNRASFSRARSTRA
jgi:UDP-glucose 4-epimerase